MVLLLLGVAVIEAQQPAEPLVRDLPCRPPTRPVGVPRSTIPNEYQSEETRRKERAPELAPALLDAIGRAQAESA